MTADSNEESHWSLFIKWQKSSPRTIERTNLEQKILRYYIATEEDLHELFRAYEMVPVNDSFKSILGQRLTFVQEAYREWFQKEYEPFCELSNTTKK